MISQLFDMEVLQMEAEKKSTLYKAMLILTAVLILSVLVNVGLWSQTKIQKNTLTVLQVELVSTRNIAGLRTQEAARATTMYNELIGKIQAAQAAQQAQQAPPLPVPQPGKMVPYSQTPEGKAAPPTK